MSDHEIRTSHSFECFSIINAGANLGDTVKQCRSSRWHQQYQSTRTRIKCSHSRHQYFIMIGSRLRLPIFVFDQDVTASGLLKTTVILTSALIISYVVITELYRAKTRLPGIPGPIGFPVRAINNVDRTDMLTSCYIDSRQLLPTKPGSRRPTTPMEQEIRRRVCNSHGSGGSQT